MKYLLLLLSLIISPILNAGDFAQLAGQLGAIIGEAAFQPLLQEIGISLGKLTQKQIDELTARHIIMWPPGATDAEIEELKKQGYQPQLSWPIPGTAYSYSPTGWIEYWRAEKTIKVPPAQVDLDTILYFGNFLKIKIGQRMTPVQAAEYLRTQYARGVIKVGTIMYLIYSSCIAHTCLNKEKDDQTLRTLWQFIKQLRPVVAWLRTIVMRDPKVYKAYSLVFALDDIVKSPNDSPYNAAINIQKWYSSNSQSIYNFMWGSPPKIS